MYYFMLQSGSGEYYTVATPEIILSAIKNNCTKFDAFVHFVPTSSKFTTKQPDYIFSRERWAQELIFIEEGLFKISKNLKYNSLYSIRSYAS